MKRIIRTLIALIALIVLVAGFSACGGGSSPDDLLKETFTGKKKFDSGKVNILLSVNAQGIPGLPQRLMPLVKALMPGLHLREQKHIWHYKVKTMLFLMMFITSSSKALNRGKLNKEIKEY